jgi:hypothetical protein
MLPREKSIEQLKTADDRGSSGQQQESGVPIIRNARGEVSYNKQTR